MRWDGRREGTVRWDGHPVRWDGHEGKRCDGMVTRGNGVMGCRLQVATIRLIVH